VPARFCSECGAVVAAPQPVAELRQLTVMFCDLVGSTALSARLDPEELRDLIRNYQTSCAGVIQRFEGSIVQYLGDGLLVYFGVPHAHEDDACRAGYAGLEIVRAIAAVSAQVASQLGTEIGVRVGIHTGPVVIGEMGAEGRVEHLAVGETPNIAARLQAAAWPNTVVASEATYRLLSRAFRCRALGPMTLTGVPRPIRAYELVETGALAEAGAGASTDSRLLVGRRQELSTLIDVWRQACDGQPGVVLVSGEAGIGKSRLVEALRERISGEGALVLEGHCSPYFQNSAFYALTQLLARWLGFTRDDGPEARRQKLDAAIATIGLTGSAATSLLASLLSLPVDTDDPVRRLGAALQRQRTIEVLVEVPRALAAARPVLLILQDLHWADPSTLEFLARATDQCGPARLVIALTCRPEFQAAWQEKSGVRRVDLGSLTAPDAETLMTAVADGKTLPPEVVRQVVARTDGVPLFIEETTRAIIESGALNDAGDRYELVGALPFGLVPMTLQDALMARLDRLGPAKVAVQLGATIGREFAYDLVQAVSESGEALLRDQLGRAVASGLLQRRGAGHETTFVFKHSLVQETAYRSLLRKTRQQHHQRIATVMEQGFPDTTEQRPELVAHHHTEAGNPARAVPYWGKAGSQAVARAAFAEAISHLSRGLSLLEMLEAGESRDRQELALQSPLGLALQARKGYAAAEVDRAYSRARELCNNLGDFTELISVLRGQHMFYGVRADYFTAMQIGERMLELAEKGGNPGHRMEAHLALGLYTLYLGDFASSRRHLESGIALAGSTDSAPAAFQHLGHSTAMCHSYLSRTLWFMGCVDEATAHSLESVKLARSLALPMTVAQATGMHTLLQQVRRRTDETLDWAQQTRAYAMEHGLVYWSALSSMVEAWGIAERGDLGQGIVQFRCGLDGYLSTGARLGYSSFLVVLGQLLARDGRCPEAFEAVSKAADHVQATGERYYEAEVHRLKGELLTARATTDADLEAEACFQAALATSRRQVARAWELRAACSLARLWQRQGRPADAFALLMPVYDRFTEGRGDADAIEARKLLDALSADAGPAARA
jgi:class 3 adenylate cyclase/predicted ATPase